MKRIDDRTVELTEREQYLSEKFDEELDKGYGIHEAVDRVKNAAEAAMLLLGGQPISDEFWDYLRG
jgi:hypothetical protein